MDKIDGTADVYAVEDVPIERIEHYDSVVTLKADGSPRVWRVDSRGFRHNRAAGEPLLIELKGKELPTCQVDVSCAAPAGTLIQRATAAPVGEPTTGRVSAVGAGATESDYRHPKCYANTRGGCSTKISGEHYISHSLIKLYGFDSPDLKIKHGSGYGVPEFVSPKILKQTSCVKSTTLTCIRPTMQLWN